ncbi:hypothetical protein C7B67_29010 [filamentous cyanobacterium Phorm 6]|nr:hypothetical protein C7B67_29010 [filamentous cyanobacterium Phorm 6]
MGSLAGFPNADWCDRTRHQVTRCFKIEMSVSAGVTLSLQMVSQMQAVGLSRSGITEQTTGKIYG